MSGKVRVIRVLEYEYEDMNQYEGDRRCWTEFASRTWQNKMRTVGVLVTAGDDNGG